jgi:hypothetical protein
MSFGSFGVSVDNQLAASPAVATSETDTLFLAGAVGGGTLDKPFKLLSTDDFVAGWGERSVQGNAATFDYIDTFFQEQGAEIIFAGFETGGTSPWEGALAGLADPTLGAGQNAICGANPSEGMYADLESASGLVENRVALRDVAAPTGVAATDVAAMLALAAMAPADDQFGATFGPWLTVPGPAGISGVGPRSVPASAAVAALCARVDADGNPNRSAGGRDYQFQYATGFGCDLTAAQVQALLDGFVNPQVEVYGALENFGFYTNVTPDPSTPYWELNCSRARMWMTSQAQVIGNNYYMRPLDGQGRLAGRFGGDLETMLKVLYDNNGLYGASPSDAYNVNVGATVNTQSTASFATLKAKVQARLSLSARTVGIDLVTVPVSGSIQS